MLKALITSLLLLAASSKAQAPAHPSMGPNDYFDIGATNYVFANDGFARTWIDEGTNRFPADKRLQALARLVPPPQKPPQPQPQNQPNPDRQKKDQDQQPQPKNEPTRNQEDKKENQQPANPNPNQSKDKSGQKDQPDDAALAAGQMTPEQAQQLLDAHKGEEQVLQFKPDKPVDRTRPIKDW